jgi:hypothetical protein
MTAISFLFDSGSPASVITTDILQRLPSNLGCSLVSNKSEISDVNIKLLTRKLLDQGFLGVMLKSSFYRHHRNRYGISVTIDHKYVLSVVITHTWLITEYVIRSTKWVPLVQHELFTLSEHPSSAHIFFTGLSGVCVFHAVKLYI